MSFKKLLQAECSYSKLAMDRVYQQMKSKQQKEKKSNKQNVNSSIGLMVIPSVGDIGEKLQRICWKYRVSTAMIPTNILESLLVLVKEKKNNLYGLQ